MRLSPMPPDGTGKSPTKDLYHKCFNLVIHGQNEEKSRVAVDEIKALREDGAANFSSYVYLTGAPGIDYVGIAYALQSSV